MSDEHLKIAFVKSQPVFKALKPWIVNQLKTKSHISYCVTSKSQIIHMDTQATQMNNIHTYHC